MFARNGKKAQSAPAQPERRRRTVSDETYRVGRTFAGDTQKARADKMARAADRKKRNIKNIATVFGVCLIIGLIAVIAVSYVANVIAEREAANVPVADPEPTVPILNESVNEGVSPRVKILIYRLENDAKSYGFSIDHVILPFQKAREIDVYVAERTEYYKLSIERGSAVQAEDISRMIRFLDEKKITPQYVDLRIEGKAYYK